MTAKELIDRLQGLHPDVLVFVSVTTAEGKKVFGTIEALGKVMYEVVTLEETEA